MNIDFRLVDAGDNLNCLGHGVLHLTRYIYYIAAIADKNYSVDLYRVINDLDLNSLGQCF